MTAVDTSPVHETYRSVDIEMYFFAPRQTQCMRNRRKKARLQTPDRLDKNVSLVAGIYVAALLGPVFVLMVVQSAGTENDLLALGLLTAVGVVITAHISWRVSRWGGVLKLFKIPSLAVLVPSLGILSVGGYLIHLAMVRELSLSEAHGGSATAKIEFVGFVLGCVALFFGVVLVVMARTRMTMANVGESDITIEWTAGWPLRDKAAVIMGLLIVFGVLAGVVLRQPDLETSTVWSLASILIACYSVWLSERTYRVTPVGLEHRRDSGVTTRGLKRWKRFTGFSVTEDAIVLHRRNRIDYRCARSDIDTDEKRIIAALEQHLDRQNSGHPVSVTAASPRQQ